jgi:arginine decarboxylase
MSVLVGKKIFFVTGKGTHRHELGSFEAALRDAGIAQFNLVYVSSILPPNCEIVSPEEGISALLPGQIVHCVMARIATNEPSRRITAALGLAIPQSRDQYGYISEHHGFGEHPSVAEEIAEDLAATMLATTLGIEFDPDDAWNERKQVYQASGQIFSTQAWSISAEGEEDGLWTTVIAAAVFVM